MSEQSEAPVASQPKSEIIETKSPNLGRRSFLKGLAGLAGIAAIGKIPDVNPNIPAPKVENKEKVDRDPKLTIIDIDPTTPFITKDQLEVAFGSENIDTAYTFVQNYFNHGGKVSEVAEDMLKRIDMKERKARLIPLQHVISQQDVQTTKDAEGNPMMSVYFDPKKIIQVLKDDPNQVINMSFQVGTVNLTETLTRKGESIPVRWSAMGDNYFLGDAASYSLEGPRDEKGNLLPKITKEELDEMETKNAEAAPMVRIEHPEIKITGAYTKDKAAENLPKLFEVCHAYPDKLFIAAAGNEQEDLRQVTQRPKNLLLVGQWGGFYEGQYYDTVPAYHVYGADIYFPNSEFKYPDGSSFSTPAVSAYGANLMNNGLSAEQAVQVIKAQTTRKTYLDANGNEAESLVLHF